MSELLSNLSDALADTTAAAGGSVVRVEARRRLPASGVVWSADGVIVTTHHVVEHDENIKIGLPDGRTVSASLAGRDPSTDLAVLRADAGTLSPAAWAGADALRVGQAQLLAGTLGSALALLLGRLLARRDRQNK